MNAREVDALKVDESIIRSLGGGEALYTGRTVISGHLVLQVVTADNQRWTWDARDCEVVR